jgi:hypothetical protein
MDPMQQDPAAWRNLGETLAGSFTARARGSLLRTSEFAIQDRQGERVGRLEIHGTASAELEAGDLQARIERPAPSRYAMLAGGKRILSAGPVGSMSTPEIRCLGRLYQGRLSLLRNRAEAALSGEAVKVRVTGGLTNRNYKAVFDADDEGSLPVAIFLLYLVVTLRREAYVTASSGRGAAPS